MLFRFWYFCQKRRNFTEKQLHPKLLNFFIGEIRLILNIQSQITIICYTNLALQNLNLIFSVIAESYDDPYL